MSKKPTAVVQRSLLSRLWYALSKQVVRSVAALVYKARYTGVENVPLTGGLLVLSNHQSHLDPPMIGCGFPRRLNFLGRKSLFVFPPFRWLIESFDAIAIDREGSPIKGLRETIRRLQGGEAVLVFPEGTRCWDGQIGPFMPGLTMMAARSGAAILPMALEGAFEAWPRTKRFPGLGRIHVHFGPPIPPEQVQAMSEEALMAETERRIRQCHAILCARPILAGKRKRNS
ncbi:MAG: lysophospholipid acyltransferase family protein [Thermoguttaceae bacterium]